MVKLRLVWSLLRAHVIWYNKNIDQGAKIISQDCTFTIGPNTTIGNKNK